MRAKVGGYGNTATHRVLKILCGKGVAPYRTSHVMCLCGRCIAMCCSAREVCCSVLQCEGGVLQCVAVRGRCVAVCCCAREVCCSVLQCERGSSVLRCGSISYEQRHVPVVRAHEL